MKNRFSNNDIAVFNCPPHPQKKKEKFPRLPVGEKNHCRGKFIESSRGKIALITLRETARAHVLPPAVHHSSWALAHELMNAEKKFSLMHTHTRISHLTEFSRVPDFLPLCIYERAGRQERGRGKGKERESISRL